MPFNIGKRGGWRAERLFLVNIQKIINYYIHIALPMDEETMFNTVRQNFKRLQLYCNQGSRNTVAQSPLATFIFKLATMFSVFNGD